MAKKFKAKIQIYDIQEPLTKGQALEINAFSNRLPGKLYSMDMTIDMKNNQPLKSKPKTLSTGDFALVTIKLEKRICLELFDNTKSMGRIALCSV
jgi:elongation factor 1 alpha-like protein